MKFGVKAKDYTAPSGDGSSGNFIKYFGKGEKTLRFLEEMSDWTVISNHFHQEKKRSFPCTGDRSTCPGCTSEDERTAKGSIRRIANALDPETGYVDLWMVPTSCITDLERHSDRDGGITYRDYTIIQYRDKDDFVKYSVDKEDKVPRDLSELKLLDHQEALNRAYDEVWGDGGEPELQEAKKPSVKRKEPEQWKNKEEAPPTFAKKKEEPTPEPEEEELDEDVELDEDELRKMSASQVKKYFKYASVEAPETDDVDELVDALIEALS